MTFRLAFITGASSGIGMALARLLAKEGINLLLTGRNTGELSLLANELRERVNVMVYEADLESSEDRKILVKKLHELTPDLVVNNAGFGAYGEAIELPTDIQLNILKVNNEALLQLTIEGAKAMKEAKVSGVIMNISSVAGFIPIPYFAVYCATKSFVNTLSLAMDQELCEEGIRVLASCPGRVETNFSLRASTGRKSPPGEKMAVAFAAKEIWWQIRAKHPIHIFDWKYRFLVFFTKYLVPRALLYRYFKRAMRK